jgi:hypothetical protein
MAQAVGMAKRFVLGSHGPETGSYEAWRAKAGFEGICLLGVVWIPLRLLQAAMQHSLLGDFKYVTAVMVLSWLSLARKLILLKWKPVDASGTMLCCHIDWSQEQMLFCLRALLAYSGAYFMLEPERRDPLLWHHFIPFMFMQASLLGFPKHVYLALVLPLNLCAVGVHFHLAGEPALKVVAFVCLLGMVLSYIFTFRERIYRRLKHFIIAAEQAQHEAVEAHREVKQAHREVVEAHREAVEAHREAALEHQRADAWQTSFRCMLDGVFDASCICDASGVIRTSTPHLDQLLSGGSGLAGFQLLDSALDASEQRRFAQFLADVARPGNMRKAQLSLVPAAPGGAIGGGRASAIEVSICGIALPKAATAGEGEGSGTQLFLGLQLLGSVEHTGEAGEGCCRAAHVLTVIREAEEADGRPESVGDTFDDLSSSICEPQPRRVPPSCRSAPAGLKWLQAEAQDDGEQAIVACAGEDGDCLPPDAVLWLEGQSRPVQVGQVKAGQRVLCYDHLARGLKYSEVVDVATHDATSSEWVVVVLEDGTELQTTADHPVYPRLAEAAVKAGDLEPSVHSLEVLKMVSVPVREVRRKSLAQEQQQQQQQQQHQQQQQQQQPAMKSDPAPAARVSLSVQQPERHSIFVASSGTGAEGSVAVASACVNAPLSAAGRQYRVKNTFVEDSEGPFELPRPNRRFRTTPALQLAGASGLEGECGSAALGAPHRSKAPSSSSVRSRSSVCERSSRSSSAAGGTAKEVLLNVGRVADRTDDAGAAYTGEISLARILELRGQGLRSIGAVGHCAGKCCPCLMETRHRNNFGTRACKHGFLCGRCHEDHSMKEFTAVQRSLRRLKRSAAEAAGASGTGGSSGGGLLTAQAGGSGDQHTRLPGAVVFTAAV